VAAPSSGFIGVFVRGSLVGASGAGAGGVLGGQVYRSGCCFVSARVLATIPVRGWIEGCGDATAGPRSPGFRARAADRAHAPAASSPAPCLPGCGHELSDRRSRPACRVLLLLSTAVSPQRSACCRPTPPRTVQYRPAAVELHHRCGLLNPTATPTATRRARAAACVQTMTVTRSGDSGNTTSGHAANPHSVN
jgi:hypothetical protein